MAADFSPVSSTTCEDAQIFLFVQSTAAEVTAESAGVKSAPVDFIPARPALFSTAVDLAPVLLVFRSTTVVHASSFLPISSKIFENISGFLS